MGSRGKEIVKVDVEKLLKMLNKALADEWLATYQYWIGAKIAVGNERSAVASEFLVHAKEEQGHADQLVERIVQLGGTPVLGPREWLEISPKTYLKPESFKVKDLLKQNITAEQGAISDYHNILEFTHGKDHATHHLVGQILRDEIHHEDELETMLEDLLST
ncbi:ferritin-like domain-containing protein [Candidatus Dependentiae bacterium]